MPNAYNKIQKRDGTVLMDLTSDTVTPNSLVSGYTAHDRSGQPVVGSVVISPITYGNVESGLSGMFRGQSLGSGTSFANASTSAQKTAISSGTFNGIFVGDYWTINNRVYRVADINYWLHITDGNVDFTTNHLVIVPDAAMGTGKMNSTASSLGGYSGSYMRSNNSSALNTAKSTIQSDFGNYLLTHRALISSNSEDGDGVRTSSVVWADSTVELMNEIMVFGHWFNKRVFTGMDLIKTDAQQQLSLFRIAHPFVNLGRYAYWLRDVASTKKFASVDATGLGADNEANTNLAVRPVFAIRGTTS